MTSITLPRRSRNIPAPVWLIGLIGLIAAPVTANPFLTALTLLVVPALFFLLWQPGQAPILLFACGMQWVQASAKLLHANFLGVEVSRLFFNDPTIEKTIEYCLLGVVVLALGMRVGTGKLSEYANHFSDAVGLQITVNGAWKAYLYAALIGLVIGKLAPLVPGLTQVLLKFSALRFFFLFVLASVVLHRKSSLWLLLLAVIMEVLVGFLGYFSGFKTVFYLLIIAYLGTKRNLSAKDYFALSTIFVVLTTLSIFWTSIKIEYRAFLSQGEKAQVVNVEVRDRLNWVSSAAVTADANTMEKGVTALAERAAYVDYFGLTMRLVPSRIAHEDGQLWWSAIRHVFMPRLLFPSKPMLPSDSELTAKYTGASLAGYSEGTSISIGYMGESYIDFGFPGMLIPIFMVGLIWGLIYRYFMKLRPYTILNQAAAMYVLLGAVLLEITNVKLLGGVLTSFIAMVLFMKFVVPIFLPYLTRQRRR